MSLVGLLGLGGAVAYGQGNAPGMPDVLGNILTAVQGVQKDVTSILAKLNAAPPAESNVAITPPQLVTGPGEILCLASNLTASTRHVRAEIIAATGPTGLFTTLAVPAGQTYLIQVNPFAGAEYARCRFEVQDGVKSDISATATILNSGVVRTVLVAQ
jgi:hypothetical protein